MNEEKKKKERSGRKNIRGIKKKIKALEVKKEIKYKSILFIKERNYI